MSSRRADRLRVALLAWAACGVHLAAAAGECRDAVRPLLLQNPPDRARMLEAQAFCAAQAEAGDVDATYQLALLLLGPLDWDPDSAIPMIRTAADAGVPEAQYWLAWQYEEGPLLPNDAAEALRWYRLAGDNDHRLALSRLADAYRDGALGLPIDARRAARMRARADRCKDRG